MYDINEVTQVNTTYIFFVLSDGTQDRKTVNKNDLKDLYIDVCSNLKNYEFMMKECKTVYDSITLEINKLDDIIKGYENFIKNNQNDPSVRRGFHSVCSSLEWTNKQQKELAFNRSGVAQTRQYASNNYDKLFKLQKDIESVLRVI